MITKSFCLYVYLFLYGGAIFALFARAIFKRRLLEDYRKVSGAHQPGEDENVLLRMLFSLPRQFQSLRDLGKSIEETPASVQRRYIRFRIFNWIAISLIVLLVVFSLTAYKICEA
jgi:hypothetical protein